MLPAYFCKFIFLLLIIFCLHSCYSSHNAVWIFPDLPWFAVTFFLSYRVISLSGCGNKDELALFACHYFIYLTLSGYWDFLNKYINK